MYDELSVRVVHITTFSKNSLDTLGIIEDRSKKFADFFWEVLDVIFIADGSNNLRFISRFSKYAI